MGYVHQNKLICQLCIIVFFMNKCILLYHVRSSCARIQLCLICITCMHFFQSFFPISFCVYISKKTFYQFLLCVKVIQHRNAFLMWFVMWFFIFFGRAETVHDNHQCSYWEHLVHIYAIFQYSIILEIVICSSSITLFVSQFYDSFVLSICITVDEKHFLSNS